MTDKEMAGVLAYMTYRRVEHRKRKLVERIVMDRLRPLAVAEAAQNGRTGSELAARDWVNAAAQLPADFDAQVRAAFLAQWTDPDPAQLLNEVAAKCAASVAYHQAELDTWAASAGERAATAEALFKELWEQRVAALAQVEADDAAGRITGEKAAAEALLAHAVALGGDAAKAPADGDVKVGGAHSGMPIAAAGFVDSVMAGV